MKYIILIFFLIASSCNQTKNVQKKIKTTKTEKKEKIVVIEEVIEKQIIKTQEDLIVVLKNP